MGIFEAAWTILYQKDAKNDLFSRGHATLHLAVSVGPSVRHIFELRAVFALLLLPNRPRLDCRVSSLVSNQYDAVMIGAVSRTRRPGSNPRLKKNGQDSWSMEIILSFPEAEWHRFLIFHFMLNTLSYNKAGYTAIQSRTVGQEQ